MSAALTRVRALLSGDFVRHGAIVFAATLLVNIFGYVFHFALSRKLGVVLYGELSALNAAFMISVVVPLIGGTIAVKYAATFHHAGDRGRLAALSRRTLALVAGGGAASLVALLALAGPIATFLRVDDRSAVMLAMAMIAMTMASGTIRGLFQGEEDFNAFAFSTIIESFLKMVLGIGFAYAGYGIVGAFGGWALGTFIALGYNVFTALAKVRGVRSAPLDLHLGKLATTMAGITAANLLVVIIQNGDLLLVKHFADPRTAGLYGALSLAGKILLFFVAFIPLIVIPKATRVALAGERPGGLLLQALGASLAMSLPGLLFFYIKPELVVTLLAGAAFAAATPYVFAYGVAMVELAVLNVLVSYKIGIHRFDFVLPLALCALGEMIGISFYHAGLAEVIRVLIVGNFVAALAVGWRIWEPSSANAALPLGTVVDVT